MKDINELLAQFDDIQDLSFSEETLGAYLEGNLSDAEQIQVQEGIALDDFINELLVDSSDWDIKGYEPSFDTDNLFITEPILQLGIDDLNPFDNCLHVLTDIFGINPSDDFTSINDIISQDDNYDC